MADRPTQVPEWATGEGADIVEPPAGKKAQGWVQGEKPPAGYFNWLFSLLTRWIEWFAQEIQGRPEGGISVPGGVESSLVRTDLVNAKHIAASGVEGAPGLAATGGPNAPAVIGTGLPGQAGGLFRGSIGIRAETEGYANTPGSAVAVEASVLPEAEGLALRCKPSTNSQPLRGAILIEPSHEPSQ